MATTKVADVANDTFNYLGSPSDLSVAFIATWIRSNVGKINNLLLTSFAIDDTTLEFSPAMSPEIQDILFKTFEIYYYDKLIRANLGASAFSAVLEVTSDGATVKRQNANNVAGSYIQLRKESLSELNQLVNGYKLKTNSPLSVYGADYISIFETADTDYVRIPNRSSNYI